MGKQADERGLLNEKFAGFEVDPQVDMWPSLHEALHPAPVRRIGWLGYASLAASVLMLVVLAWLYLDPPILAEKPLAYRQAAIADSIAASRPAGTATTDSLLAGGESVLPAESKQPAPVDAASEASDRQPQQAPAPATRPSPAAERQLALNEAEPEKAPRQERAEDQASEPEMPLPAKPLLRPVAVASVVALPAADVESYTAEVGIDQVEVDRSNFPRAEPEKNQGFRLRDLTLDDAILFASNGLNKLIGQPAQVYEYERETEDGRLKAYEIRFGNFRIKKKRYQRN